MIDAVALLHGRGVVRTLLRHIKQSCIRIWAMAIKPHYALRVPIITQARTKNITYTEHKRRWTDNCEMIVWSRNSTRKMLTKTWSLLYCEWNIARNSQCVRFDIEILELDHPPMGLYALLLTVVHRFLTLNFPFLDPLLLQRTRTFARDDCITRIIKTWSFDTTRNDLCGFIMRGKKYHEPSSIGGLRSR